MKYPIYESLDLSKIPNGTISRCWIQLVEDGLGQPVLLPIMISKATEPGPVIGLTAVVHGNELNGLKVIMNLFDQLADEHHVRGTIVGIPVVNVPSIHLNERRFPDDEDLNRIMPGSPTGNRSAQYANHFIHRILHQFEYLIDLHTASFGRINSYYIRANLDDPVVKKLALLQGAQIILDNSASDNTLRGAAMQMGIKAITVEVGDPNKFQKGLIRSSLTGIFNVLADLGIVEGEVEDAEEEAIICSSSTWLHTDRGGILEVLPGLAAKVPKNQKIAVQRDPFGEIIKLYECPSDGVVIGKSVMPISSTGSRILHLGKVI